MFTQSSHCYRIYDVSRSVRTSVSDATMTHHARYGEVMRNEVVECPLDVWLHHYLPFFPPDKDIEVSVDLLAKKGMLRRRKGWETADSGPSKRGIKHLLDISATLQDYESPSRSRTCRLVRRPNATQTTSIPGPTHEIDSLFELLDSTVPQHPHSRNTLEASASEMVCNIEYTVKKHRARCRRSTTFYNLIESALISIVVESFAGPFRCS